MENKKVITAEPGYVFYVVFTPKVTYKTFYKFYSPSYEFNPSDDNTGYLFKGSKVPLTIMSDIGPVKVSQEIKAPELSKRVSSLFVFKTKKPDWFDVTEEQVLSGDFAPERHNSLSTTMEEQVFPIASKALN